MLKDIRVYQLDAECPSLEQLEKVAEGYPARECQYLEQNTIGFREFVSMPGARVLQVEGSRFIYLEVLRFRRSVPKSVMAREIRKRVKARTDRGEEVNKEEVKLIGEEVLKDQLPKMPQMETVIPLVFDHAKQQMWIGAGSDGMSDDVIKLLRRSGLSIAPAPIFQSIDLGRWLSDWMLQQQELPDSAVLGVKAKIADPHEPKATITINNEELTDDELQAVASSRSVSALELMCESTRFTLNHDGAFKSIKLEFPAETFDDLAHLAAFTLLEVANTVDVICGAVGAPQTD